MGETLTIDELAVRVGMTSRNIRAHQTRGLLPPPVLEGRVGRYGEEHVARLELIKRLQADGLNLQAVAMIINEADGGVAERLKAALIDPWATEDPVDQPVADVVRRLGGSLDPDVLRRAEDAGVVEMLDGDTVRLVLPSVVRSAEAMLELGVPLPAQIGVVEAVDALARAVAETYIALAREHLVGGLADKAVASLDDVRAEVEELSAVAAEVLLTLFRRAMTDASTRLFAEVLGPAD